MIIFGNLEFITHFKWQYLDWREIHKRNFIINGPFKMRHTGPLNFTKSSADKMLLKNHNQGFDPGRIAAQTTLPSTESGDRWSTSFQQFPHKHTRTHTRLEIFNSKCSTGKIKTEAKTSRINEVVLHIIASKCLLLKPTWQPNQGDSNHTAKQRARLQHKTL